MRLSCRKINIDTKRISKTFVHAAETISKNKKFQIVLASIPVGGWISSEIHRAVDNKKHQEQLALYQEALRKHQAEIDILKNDKEREEYKQKLWNALFVNETEEHYE